MINRNPGTVSDVSYLLDKLFSILFFNGVYSCFQPFHGVIFPLEIVFFSWAGVWLNVDCITIAMWGIA